jgi:hypothetical protein
VADIFIKIEKKDIKISNLDENIIIQCDNNINLLFTKESIKELLVNSTNIKLYTKNEVSNLIKDLIKSADFISFTEAYGPMGWVELNNWIEKNIE